MTVFLIIAAGVTGLLVGLAAGFASRRSAVRHLTAVLETVRRNYRTQKRRADQAEGQLRELKAELNAAKAKQWKPRVSRIRKAAEGLRRPKEAHPSAAKITTARRPAAPAPHPASLTARSHRSHSDSGVDVTSAAVTAAVIASSSDAGSSASCDTGSSFC